MATLPVPRTYVASENLTATILNGTTGIKGPLDFLLSPPRCGAYQTASTNMATSGVGAVILWDTELYDTDSIHSTVTNTSRFTSATTGLYRVHGSLGFAANATGYRSVNVRKNAAGASGGGTSVGVFRVPATATLSTLVPFSCSVQLTAGDYIEVFGAQASGGALATDPGVGNSSIYVEWIANS